jgi:hypothetical protein
MHVKSLATRSSIFLLQHRTLPPIVSAYLLGQPVVMLGAPPPFHERARHQP